MAGSGSVRVKVIRMLPVPYLKTEIGTLYCEDCLMILNNMQDNTVDLTVTSPPYDNLRDYKGYSFKFEEIAKELYRVTAIGGVVVWVVKDAVIEGNRTLTSYRQAIYFQEIGFKVFDVIIWNKPSSSLPHKNRYHDTFEYMFIFSKGLPKTINLLKDKKNKYGGETTWSDRTVREKDGTLTNKGKTIVNDYGVRYNVWSIAAGFGKSTVEDCAFEHPATFPEQLAKDHILSWSKETDLVLDPFMGSGTTGKMAEELRRRWIGIEISKEYCDIAVARLKKWKGQARFE